MTTRCPIAAAAAAGSSCPRSRSGLWQNFGSANPLDTQRAIILRAFDLGVTHFDLANNYGGSTLSTSDDPLGRLKSGPPYGSAESNFGGILRADLRPYRDELIISTKAGYDMWPGPYGEWGSRKYLLASLDQSLARMGLEYVDIFYSHRFDPDTPLEETMGALHTAVTSGKALYAGISSYSAERTAEAADDPAGDGHAAADPPAVLLHAEPLDRRRAAGRARRRGHRLHRVLAAGAGPAHEPVPERHPRRLAGEPRRVAVGRPDQRREPRPRPGAERDREGPRPVAGAAGLVVGAARPAGHLGADRREQRRASSRRTSPQQAGRRSLPTSSPRSISKRSTLASTSGRRPARTDPRGARYPIPTAASKTSRIVSVARAPCSAMVITGALAWERGRRRPRSSARRAAFGARDDLLLGARGQQRRHAKAGDYPGQADVSPRERGSSRHRERDPDEQARDRQPGVPERNRSGHAGLPDHAAPAGHA